MLQFCNFFHHPSAALPAPSAPLPSCLPSCLPAPGLHAACLLSRIPWRAPAAPPDPTCRVSGRIPPAPGTRPPPPSTHSNPPTQPPRQACSTHPALPPSLSLSATHAACPGNYMCRRHYPPPVTACKCGGGMHAHAPLACPRAHPRACWLRHVLLPCSPPPAARRLPLTCVAGRHYAPHAWRAHQA